MKGKNGAAVLSTEGCKFIFGITWFRLWLFASRQSGVRIYRKVILMTINQGRYTCNIMFL